MAAAISIQLLNWGLLVVEEPNAPSRHTEGVKGDRE